MINFKSLQHAAITSLENPGISTTLPKFEKPGRPTLYLFRHTQTKDNIRRIFSGRRQTSLTKEGEKQATALAQKLKSKKIDLFISPPLYRCQQTLKPLQKFFPKITYLKKKELIERNYGDLTGKSKMQIMKKYPEKAVLWRRSFNVAPPRGESLSQVWETRIKPFCQWLEAQMKTKKINVCYCGTNNTIRLIRMYFEKLPIEKMLTLETPYGDYAAYSLNN